MMKEDGLLFPDNVQTVAPGTDMKGVEIRKPDMSFLYEPEKPGRKFTPAKPLPVPVIKPEVKVEPTANRNLWETDLYGTMPPLDPIHNQVKPDPDTPRMPGPGYFPGYPNYPGYMQPQPGVSYPSPSMSKTLQPSHPGR